MKKSFKTTIVREQSLCFIPVPFDPKLVFGKVRAPVVVTLNGYSYRSTIASMGNGPCVEAIAGPRDWRAVRLCA